MLEVHGSIYPAPANVVLSLHMGTGALLSEFRSFQMRIALTDRDTAEADVPEPVLHSSWRGLCTPMGQLQGGWMQACRQT